MYDLRKTQNINNQLIALKMKHLESSEWVSEFESGLAKRLRNNLEVNEIWYNLFPPLLPLLCCMSIIDEVPLE